ncbi:MAG: hypothetical protein ACRBDI_07490 [Alphaproteobacteria bacterium]
MLESQEQELHDVIDEMSAAYQSVSDYDYMNADYAEYAIMALSRFRRILGNPNLTCEELKFMLRKSMAQHKTDGVQGCWKGFVAAQIAHSSNANPQYLA